jgi:hypothetical protein
MSLTKLATLLFVGSIAVAPLAAQEIAFHAAQTSIHVSSGYRIPVETKLVRGAPYSAEVESESIQTLADGNRIVQRTTARLFRDGEGRVRREEDRPSGLAAVSITDPVTGTSVSLDMENHRAFQTPTMAWVGVTDALQKVHEMATSFNYVAGRRVDEDVKVERLPARTIEGVRADGLRRTTTIAAGAIGNELPIQIVSEEWLSPELQVLVLTERSDPRFGTSTYRLRNINRTEPPAFLFQVPSDYTIMKRGEINKPIAPAAGGRGKGPQAIGPAR